MEGIGYFHRCNGIICALLHRVHLVTLSNVALSIGI